MLTHPTIPPATLQTHTRARFAIYPTAIKRIRVDFYSGNIDVPIQLLFLRDPFFFAARRGPNAVGAFSETGFDGIGEVSRIERDRADPVGDVCPLLPNGIFIAPVSSL